MTTTDGSRSAASRQAEAFYNAELRAKLEPAECGKYIVIDLKSHDYEVDDNLIVATVHLQDRQPDAKPFAFRIGYDARKFVLHGKPISIK